MSSLLWVKAATEPDTCVRKSVIKHRIGHCPRTLRHTKCVSAFGDVHNT